MEKEEQKWIRGDQAKLALRCRISHPYLSAILNRKKRALPELAKLIEGEASTMGYDLTRIDVMYPLESNNTLLGPVRNGC